MSVDELSPFGSDKYVASQSDLEPSGDREPRNRSDDRLPAAFHLQNRIGFNVLHIPLEHLLRRTKVYTGTEGSP